MGDSVDLLVVGGGINGVGIARDAAGRGLTVQLCEAGDLAGATSSASSKLIHGGLRYLEHCAFRLVRESLIERAVLLRLAPHLIRPRRFVLPHEPGVRPRWMIRAGLFLYDRLGGRSLPPSRAVQLCSDPLGAPLRERWRDGFVYSDCCVDDSRLVVANARDAARHGAAIATRTAMVAARRDGRGWRVSLRGPGDARRELEAGILVNAAGPWAGEVLRDAGLRSRATLRLVKGSHIVVPRLYEGDHAYILQNEDRRVVFVIPYEDDFTLIGTTDLAFDGDPATAAILPQETEYLCRAVSRYFREPPTPESVVWSYAGVRPLYDDGKGDASAVTRDYVFDLDRSGPPALSIFGGKLTTYRRLAEHALARLAPYLPDAGPAWTAGSVLPGGEGAPARRSGEALRRDYPFLDAFTAARLARGYGADAWQILGKAGRVDGLGDDFGQGLTRREVDWLVTREWARTADDVLWRRSKLGLRLSAAQAGELQAYLDRSPAAGPQSDAVQVARA
ncbi:MAG: glycerol-3-phosphate dehydrogenase [Alphaproteobacteria bacterium]|nr:glycerol-3-phosphate dehydrogenase [Alphaproteobacteria bacterium]